MKSFSVPEIYGHRGAAYDMPENTLPSFRKAWRDGSDGCELDIHVTSDQKLIVMHDYNTSRTGSGVDYVLKDTDSDTLRKVDVGSFKNRKFKGVTPPLLDNVLKIIPRHQKLYVEIKSGTETVSLLKQKINSCGKKDRIEIIGFNRKVMQAAKKAMPEMNVMWLVANHRDPKTSKPIPYDLKIIKQAKQAKVDGLDLQSDSLNAKVMKAARKAGLKVYVWTVDDLKEARRVTRLGVDSITTNRPLYVETHLKAWAAGRANEEPKEQRQIASEQHPVHHELQAPGYPAGACVPLVPVLYCR
jgi:glycerophosphoryl diester phosphodiesterase